MNVQKENYILAYTYIYIYIILLLVVVKVMFAKLGDKDGKKYIISTTRCGENRFSAKWNRKNKNMESRDSPKGLNRVSISRFTFNFHEPIEQSRLRR